MFRISSHRNRAGNLPWKVGKNIIRSHRSKQNENAPSPIAVTDSGILIEVSPLIAQNAFSPIDVTVFGITVFTQPVTSSFVLVLMTALQFSLESKTVFAGSTVMPLNEQYLNEAEPIDATLLGMFSTP